MEQEYRSIGFDLKAGRGCACYNDTHMRFQIDTRDPEVIEILKKLIEEKGL